MNFTSAEKQLISTICWFRSYYSLFQKLDQNRKASKEAIEFFGATWIGKWKEDWTATFDSLIQKGIIQQQGNQYQFTEKGESLKHDFDTENPFFQYEYDNFFALQEESQAHTAFCKRVYGMNLSQHGLIDRDELALLEAHLQSGNFERILDIGCGNGRITEHLAANCPGKFHGIDISSQAIQQAQERTQANPSLSFSVGNMNQLAFEPDSFDAIISLDTLYYVKDLGVTLQAIQSILKPGGRFFAYFSQWIMDAAYPENLEASHTHLAKALQGLGANYNTQDLTQSGLAHWKRKLAVLNEMKADFEAEGSLALWDYRHREAERYGNWGDDKYARYLYEVVFA